MTVAQVKASLRRKKYLHGHAPTEKALASRIAIWRRVETPDADLPRLRTTYPVWHAERVIRILRRSGAAQHPTFLTTSRKQARKNYAAFIVRLARQIGAPSGCDMVQAALHLSNALPKKSAAGALFDAWHHTMGFDFLFENMMDGIAQPAALRCRMTGLFLTVERDAGGDHTNPRGEIPICGV